MDKYHAFRQLHESNESFVLPNPWDIGSARLLKESGFKALATTSAGHAYSFGQGDGSMDTQRILNHCKMLVDATDLPVTGDLGKGFGNTPEAVAETIKKAGETGLAGCSIEDYTGDPGKPIFDFNLAVERIAAACEAKNNLQHDFILTARCDNYAWDIRQFDQTVERLKAFELAGADVLYPPGLDDLHEITQCCEALDKPVNIVLESLPGTMTIKILTDAGVKRMSLGSGLYLAAMNGFLSSIGEIRNTGTLNFLEHLADYSELEATFGSHNF